MELKNLSALKRINAIYNRVSCRSFQEKPIANEILKEIITAATMAPASGNMQPWEFIIVDDPTRKERISEHTFSGFYSKGAKSQTWIKDAALIIIPCVNYKRTIAKYGDLAYEWAVIDTTSAVQNMLLSAEQLGVSSCWVGGFKKHTIQEMLQVPPYVHPLGLIPMGYAQEKTARKKKIDAKWVTHRNSYNQPFFN